MAAHRSVQQLAHIGDFIQRLYVAAGYATWKEFADDANLSAPQLSDFQLGKSEPSGYNLLKLIHAAARRAASDEESLAFGSAAAVGGEPDPSRLEALADDVASLLLGQAEILQRIDGALPGAQASQKPSAPKRKAASRRDRQR